MTNMESMQLSQGAMELVSASIESSVEKCDNTMSFEDMLNFHKVEKARNRAEKVNRIFGREMERQAAVAEMQRNRSAELDRQLNDLYNKI